MICQQQFPVNYQKDDTSTALSSTLLDYDTTATLTSKL